MWLHRVSGDILFCICICICIWRVTLVTIVVTFRYSFVTLLLLFAFPFSMLGHTLLNRRRSLPLCKLGNDQVAVFRPNVAVNKGDRIELLPNKSGTNAIMRLVGGVRVRYS